MTIRDLRVIEFLQEQGFKIARTSTLTALFFDGKIRVAQRRLKALSENNEINRIHEGEYIYYSKLPKQYLHSLALTDYVAYLAQKYNLDLGNAKAEFTCGKIRSDALLTINGRPYFVEVQLTDSADMSKYLALKNSKEWGSCFKTFPTIRVLGNAPQDRLGLDVVVDDVKNVFAGYSLTIRFMFV